MMVWPCLACIYLTLTQLHLIINLFSYVFMLYGLQVYNLFTVVHGTGYTLQFCIA